MSYPKPWKSYDEQLAQLMVRGMQVTDRAKALDCLERIGYYRLSGYWYPFRQRRGRTVLDTFRADAFFQNAVDLYVFDKQLRLLALDALERIEVALRVDVSHTLGEIDRFAYLKPELFHESFSVTLDKRSGVTAYHVWLGKHAQLIARSKEDFLRHNRDRYGLPIAIWVACEVWDFGTLSNLFGGMREPDQDAIARRYGISNGRIFASWLRSLNYLRNVCAHHSRLWNRNIVDQPRLPAADELPWVEAFEVNSHARARCFLLLKMIRQLVSRVNPNSSWPAKMKAHLLAFPDLSHLDLNVAGMGAQKGWEAVW